MSLISCFIAFPLLPFGVALVSWCWLLVFWKAFHFQFAGRFVAYSSSLAHTSLLRSWVCCLFGSLALCHGVLWVFPCHFALPFHTLTRPIISFVIWRRDALKFSFNFSPAQEFPVHWLIASFVSTGGCALCLFFFGSQVPFYKKTPSTLSETSRRLRACGLLNCRCTYQISRNFCSFYFFLWFSTRVI